MSSEHDQAVLDSIFNPYLPLGEGIAFQPPLEDQEIDQVDDSGLPDEAKKLELEGVVKAERGDLEEAVDLLTQAVQMSPDRASILNNRAQAYRLQGNDSAALSDLNKAVCLSGGRGLVGTQALCQRGLILRRQGDEPSAQRDFQAAAKLGSDFTRQQLVQMNPYAAMCNQMLRQVFSKLQQPSNPL